MYCASFGSNNLESLRAIKVSTFGVLFFGTPHSGANGVQVVEWLVRLSSIFMDVTSKHAKYICQGSDELGQLGQEYLPISHDFETIFFYETYRMPTIGGKPVLVCLKPICGHSGSPEQAPDHAV